MRLWLDAEFNGFQGKLISMALVAEDGREWYESLGCLAPTAWVSAHVMPVINKRSCTRAEMQRRLACFLRRYDHIHVIADWPEDFVHFLELLIVAPGVCNTTPPLLMEICSGLTPASSKMDNDNAISVLLNERELARMLSVSVSLVQKWRVRGEGPVPIRIGRNVRYSQATVAKFIDECAKRVAA
jgi:predicted DNA-binding transcriptional regulator AlpA